MERVHLHLEQVWPDEAAKMPAVRRPREDVWAERVPPSPVVPIGWWVPALSEEPGAAQTKEEQGHLVRPDASEE